MALGPITAVRVFQDLKNLLAFVQGKLHRTWFNEQLGPNAALPQLVDALDRQAAVDQTARMRQEHTDAYCLQRDHFYGRRSRKWLYTQAAASQVERNYGVWLSFIRLNSNIQLTKFTTQDPDSLSRQSPAQLLELKHPV